MDTKEKIIRTVIELGAKHGLENFTIKDISEKSNNSSSIIYYYFKDKDELIVTALIYIVQQEAAVINAAMSASESYENNYKNSMRSIGKYFSKNKSHGSFYMKANISCLDSFKSSIGTLIEICPMLKFLERGVNDGYIIDLPHILNIAYFPLMTHVTYQYHTKEAVSEDVVNKYIDIMWKAISTEK